MKSREGNQIEIEETQSESKRNVAFAKTNVIASRFSLKKAAAPANAGYNLKDKLDKSQLSHKTCQRQAAFFRNEKGV